MTTHRLHGLTVLLVEDDVFVSMLAEDVLREAGAEVLLAMRLELGLQLAATADLDFAVLDVNLGQGRTSYPMADLLSERGIPFFFLTGYDGEGFSERYSDHLRLQKPYSPEQLLAASVSLNTGRF
jgi:DNA-binding response OmpR family regulator